MGLWNYIYKKYSIHEIIVVLPFSFSFFLAPAFAITSDDSHLEETQSSIQVQINNEQVSPVQDSDFQSSPSHLKNTSIPIHFVSLGNKEKSHAIVVEKKKHLLTVFELNGQDSYEPIKTFRAITGKGRGVKKVRGDNNTPEGIYFITNVKEKQDLFRAYGNASKKYGPKAFVLDYPNIFDERLRKTGGGIWIHGVENERRTLNPFDTEGCVALTNSDVLELTKYIENFDTPVIIVSELATTSLDSIVEQRNDVLKRLEEWRMAWEKSDFSLYQSFYSKDFKALGKHKKKWLKFKNRISDLTKGKIQVVLSEPKILRFENQLLVEFKQKYTSPIKQDFGRKFLYLQKEADGYRIISEKFYKLEHDTPFEIVETKKNTPTEKVSGGL